MLMVVDSLVFVGAFGVAVFAIGGTIAPNLGKIADALAGRQQATAVEPRVRAARRAAVRRWASSSPATVRMREAA